MNAAGQGRQSGERRAEVLRLFLVLPGQVPVARAIACVRAFCAQADAASLLLPDGDEARAALVSEAQALGLAVLVEGGEAAMRRLGADGVHVTGGDARQLARLRRLLGEEMILGACCPQQRHAAMELGEAGADYLGIDQRVEARGENLLAWWAQMFTVPVVAMRPAAPEQLAQLARMGADFAVPPVEMWQDEEAAEALGRACGEQLRRIAQGHAAGAKSG